MKTFSVILPVAGHVIIEIDAEDEERAIALALDAPFTVNDIETFEVLNAFHQGNVCYCPTPWDATAERIDTGEDK